MTDANDIVELKTKIVQFKHTIDCTYKIYEQNDSNTKLRSKNCVWLNGNDSIELLATAQKLLTVDPTPDKIIEAEKHFYKARHLWHKSIISSISGHYDYIAVTIQIIYFF